MKDELTDGRVRLRRYRDEDVQALFAAATESIDHMRPWMPWCHKGYTMEESRQWVEINPVNWGKGSAYDFVIEDASTAAFVGGCGLNDIDLRNKRANLGYWVRASRIGEGFAPAATLLLARWALEELALRRVEILVAVGNSRSLRVAEKVGATREGILRNRLVLCDETHDAVMHSLIPADLGLI